MQPTNQQPTSLDQRAAEAMHELAEQQQWTCAHCQRDWTTSVIDGYRTGWSQNADHNGPRICPECHSFVHPKG